MTGPGEQAADRYALDLAEEAHTWYRRAAARARNGYRISEVLLLLVSASIPVSAVILKENVTIPAVLGAIVVVISGLRSVFHWHENYIRFSRAREAVEVERRLYLTGHPPYDNPGNRDAALAAAVSKVQQEEIGGWAAVASAKRAGT